MWFCIYALAEMSELAAQMYFFLCRRCILGDTFKNTGYVVLIRLVMLFAQVGESTGVEAARPNYVGIDHYFVCLWLNVAKKRRNGVLHKYYK